jgi:hypothetical protein
VASVDPSSFMASGGVAASAPNSFPIRLIIPMEVSWELYQRIFNETAVPALDAGRQRAAGVEEIRPVLARIFSG